MQNAFRFEKLLVYQKALSFSTQIYHTTNSWPNQHRFTLSDQLQRAALSIPLNIAEGTSRSKKDSSHFLSIARGSCYECIPLLTIAENLKLISLQVKDLFYNNVYELARMISSLRTSLS